MASKNIDFDTIPSSIRKPGKYFEFNTKLAVRTLPANKLSVLIVGQRLAAGTVAELVPTKAFSDAQVAEHSGEGSIAHLMARAAIGANPYLDLTLVTLDDAAAAPVAATGDNTLAGDATSSGSAKMYINNKVVEVGIAIGDTPSEVAVALNVELAKHPDLPTTTAVNGGVPETLDFTAKNKGTVGNQIGLAMEISAKGMTSVITAMSGGAVDPDVASALATVFAEQYDVTISPYNDQTSVTALRDHLDSVSGALEQRPGRGVYSTTGTLAEATTLGALINGGRMNHQFLRGTRSASYEVAAAFGSIMAFEEDPAMPLNGLDLPGIHAPAIDQRLSRTEQESCLYNGVSPLEVGPGERVQIVRAVTTYIKDAQDIDDISLLDTTTIATLDYTRKACRARVALRFPRAKLSSRTPPKVWTEIFDVLLKLEELEILEEVMANKDGLIVERDDQSPTQLNTKIPADVVNGLHVLAGRIDLLL